MFFDVNDDLEEWVLKEAAVRWKDFKCEIKRKYFREELPNEELYKMQIDERVPEKDWKWLVKHWRTPESQVEILVIYCWNIYMFLVF